MSRNRRTELARTLARTTHLSYQQALAALAAHTDAGHPLPRTDAELTQLAQNAPLPSASEHPVEPGPVLTAAVGTVENLRAAVSRLRPGTPVVSTWPTNADAPGPHDRVVVAVHLPGQPAVDDIATEDLAVALTDPHDPAGSPLWMVLPDEVDDRAYRWTVAQSDDAVSLTQHDQVGVVVGTYAFDLTCTRALRRVGDVAPQPLSFVIRSSDIGRCPGMVMGVSHYLPTGECAHQSPTCPTCGGTGVLIGEDGTPVTCAVSALLPPRTPVCAGTGHWAGVRANTP